MSGGSWDYFSHRLEEVAIRLKCDKKPNRRALGNMLLKASKALHDIEWVDSDDYGPGDDDAAIMEALGSNASVLILEETIDKAKLAHDELKVAIDKALKTLSEREARNDKCL